MMEKALDFAITILAWELAKWLVRLIVAIVRKRILDAKIDKMARAFHEEMKERERQIGIPPEAVERVAYSEVADRLDTLDQRIGSAMMNLDRKASILISLMEHSTKIKRGRPRRT